VYRLFSKARLSAYLLIGLAVGGASPLSAATSFQTGARGTPKAHGATERRAEGPGGGLAGKRFVVQTSAVRTGCFPGRLRAMVAQLGRSFGATPVVTSGFRPGRRTSRFENGRRRGSLHAHCMAADVQIPGVAPSRVFAAAKRLPGRGGVGLYCHTRSVHIDVGERREWSQACHAGRQSPRRKPA